MTTHAQMDKAIKEVSKSGKQLLLPIDGSMGLELRIRPRPAGKTPTATFRHRYTNPSTQSRHYITVGQYPVMTLREAKQAHLDNLRVLAQGQDPIAYREQALKAQEVIANSGFADVAQSWLDKQVSNPSRSLSASTIASYKRDIEIATAEFKDIPVNQITRKMVVELCASVQEKHTERGKRVRSTCERIFNHARDCEYMDSNPASDIELPTAPTKHQPAITNPIQFGKLLRDINALDESNERAALQLMALLFTRSGDMCAMKWSDIDFEGAQWTLAPQKGQGRSDMVDSLIIPLPKQAIAILREQQQRTGSQEYVFYSSTHKAQHINKQRLSATLNKLDNGSWAGKHVPHGFRASAITMIQEQLKYEKYLPDMQSGHAIKDNNGTAYNRVKFIEERTKMMNDWADYQDALKAEKTIIRANFKQQVKAFG